jgi:hypothetical protein
MAHLNPCVSVAAESPYRVRAADIESDQGNILHLCRTSALNGSPEKYRWNREGNPFGPTWCALAIESSSEQVVGTTALFPRRLLVDGTSLRAAVAGDFAVEPKHRTLYPAMVLQKAALAACQAGVFDVLYGFPNNAARPVQFRAGYRSVGQVTAGVRLLRTRAALAKRGQAFWSWGADIFDSILTLMSRESRVNLSTSYRYASLPRFDARFDRFWAHALAEHRIIVERDSLYANWRFIECPIRRYSLFTAVHNTTGEIGGYVVWSSSQDGKIRISDLMADDHAFDGLLTAFIRQQRDQNADCITIAYLGNTKLVRNLRRFGFMFRRTRSEVLLCVKPGVPVPERFFDSDNWYLLDGDSDS